VADARSFKHQKQSFFIYMLGRVFRAELL
jgi:hypothetical protein